MEASPDIKAWLVFMESFNGKSLFLPTFWDSSLSLNLYTDASNSDFSGYLGTSWFAETWPQAFTDLHINIKELFPIVLALELWGVRLADKCITFHSDNLSVVYVVNKQSSKDKFLMRLVRRLVIKCMTYNINFQAAHVPGIDNTFADLLSRQKYLTFCCTFHYRIRSGTIFQTDSSRSKYHCLRTGDKRHGKIHSSVLQTRGELF